jgi:hypothetical protein
MNKMMYKNITKLMSLSIKSTVSQITSDVISVENYLMMGNNMKNKSFLLIMLTIIFFSCGQFPEGSENVIAGKKILLLN